MHFFGFYVYVRRESNSAIVDAKICDRYLLALNVLKKLTRQYPQPDYVVSLGTLKCVPNLRGHPAENVRNIAKKEMIPEEVLLQAWAQDNHNSHDIAGKISLLSRKYLHLGLAFACWVASFFVSFQSITQPKNAMTGMIALALWASAVVLLYLHEKEWGFAYLPAPFS
jgi:hypothetical protein